MAGLRSTMLRILKPVVAGLGIAYVVTAFVDKPAPVHFQPDNPYAAQQTAIVEPYRDVVEEKNILKLGSPLSAGPDEFDTRNNPLAPLEERLQPEDDAVAPDGNGTVRGGVDESAQP